MVNLIIKNWYNYIGKKIVATEFLIKMRDITNRNNYYTIINNNIIGDIKGRGKNM